MPSPERTAEDLLGALAWQVNLRGQKGPTKPRNRANNTKAFSEQFEGKPPSKTRVLRQIVPESSPESSAKSSSHNFFMVPFFCPSFPCRFGFPRFFLFKEILAFLTVFCFFPKDFGGSPARTNPCWFCGFFLVFPKRQGKEDMVPFSVQEQTCQARNSNLEA